MNKNNKNIKNIVEESFTELAKAIRHVCDEDSLLELFEEASKSKPHRELWKLTIETLSLLDKHTQENANNLDNEIVIKFEGNPSIKRKKTDIFDEV